MRHGRFRDTEFATDRTPSTHPPRTGPMKPASLLPLALLCFAGPSLAFEAVPSTLPTLAANPWAGTPMGAWSGFSGRTGHFDTPFAGAFARSAGYNQLLNRNLLLGVETTTLNSPMSFGRNAAFGMEFSSTTMRLTYNLGNLRPFVTAGAAFARPNDFGPPNFSFPGDPLSNSRDAKTFTSVGAGFDYAVTNNFSVGVAVSAGSGQALRSPGSFGQ